MPLRGTTNPAYPSGTGDPGGNHSALPGLQLGIDTGVEVRAGVAWMRMGGRREIDVELQERYSHAERILTGPMANIERQPAVTTRSRKRTPAEYRSSLLDMLGMSSPYEHAITQARQDIVIAKPSAPSREADTLFPRIEELPRSAGTGEDAAAAGLVQRLWQATEAVDQDLIIEDWAPETPLDRTVGRYRWAWWPVLLGLLVIGIILVVTNLRGIPVSQANDLRSDWATGALEVEASISDARNAATVITDATAQTASIAEARNLLIRFDTSAAALETLVSRPFPTPPPLASGDVFDALKPIQTELIASAGIVSGVEDLLSDAITYRSLIEGSFLLPPLPIVADEITLSNLGEQIATAVSSTRAAVRQLPIGPEFDAHRSQAQALVNRLEGWQASYLNALRLSDIDAATELKTEITDRITALRNTVNQPLELVGVQITADLDRLELLLGEAVDELSVPVE